MPDKQQGLAPAVSGSSGGERRASPSKDWLEVEPGLPAAVHEVQRVFRRARGRPLVTLTLTSLAVLVLIGMAARKVKTHRATVVLRVSERTFAGATPIMARGDLRNHVYSVILARDRLLGLMEEHDLYVRERQLGEDLALSAMRVDLDVDVFRNYFLVVDNLQATARIAIRYRSVDREAAVAVALGLAQAVIEFEQERRKESALISVRIAEEAVDRATEHMEEREKALAVAQMRLGESRGARAASLQVEVGMRRSAVEASQLLLHEALAQKEELELVVGAEERRLAMAIEIAQIRRPPPPTKSRTKLFVALGVIGFLFALPLCALAVGAFDSRVHDIEDVERIGMPGLGHVPGFMGSGDGALAERMRPSRRLWRRG